MEMTKMQTEEERWQPHAVVLPYPGQGHINPLMQLSLTLASSMGFFVTFVSTQRNHESMVDAWARRGILPPLERGISIHLASIRDDMLPERNMKDIPKFIVATRKMQEPFVEFMEGLVKKKSPAVSCIISDSILGWVQDVASMFSVPWIAYYPLPVSTFLVEQHVPLLLAAGNIPVEEDNVKEDDVLHIPGLPPVHPRDLPHFTQNNPIDPQYRDVITTNQRLKKASWVFVNSCDALEGAEILAAQQQGFVHLLPIGPLLPSGFLRDDPSSDDMGITGALWGEEDGCLEWLDKQPPSSVLYVSFGSVSNITLAELGTLMQALVNSHEAFLWVLRPNLVMGMQEEVFVEREANKHGLVVRWAPQLKVLRHPSIGTFLTHCGWNSTFESICAGVPMIGWPCFFEQSLNCKYIVDVWKIGMRFAKEPGGTVAEAEIVRVVQEMMRGDKGIEIRKRSAELRNACTKDFLQNNKLTAFVAGL